MPAPDMAMADGRAHEGTTPRRVCMHVLGTARIDARVMREATALTAAGYQVTIVDIEASNNRPREETIAGVRLKHIVMRRRYTPVRFKPWFLVKLARMIAQGTWVVSRTPADAYHAHDENALSACYFAARLRHVPLVFDAHEVPLVAPRVTRWKRLHALARHRVRRLVRHCAAIITVSPPIVDELRQRYGGVRATLVRNVPAYQPPKRSNRLREYLGLGPDVRIALYQGNLQADRQLDALVHAAKYLAPDAIMVMLGDGPCRSQLEQLVESEGVQARVRIVPAVPYRDLLDWTASADLGLILFPRGHSPSVRLCLPNKLFEYLMAGLPVLTSRLDAVQQVVAHYGVGAVVETLEPKSVARAINTLLADDAARALMRQHALDAARDALNWECEQRTLLALYARVLGRGHGPAAGATGTSDGAAPAPADVAAR